MMNTRRVLAGAAVLLLGLPAGAARAASLSAVPTGGLAPVAATGGPDGSLWFVGATSQRPRQPVRVVGRITSEGDTEVLSLPLTPGATWTRIASNDGGDVWVLDGPGADRSASHAGRLRADGSVERIPVRIGAHIAPGSVAVDGDGRLFVGDTTHARVVAVNAKGQVRTTPLRHRRVPGANRRPLLLAPAGAATLWVADGPLVLRLSGSHLRVRRPLPFPATGIAADASGTLWVVGASGQVAHVSSRGSVAVLGRRLPGRRGGSVTAGAHGRMWFSVPGARRIVAVTRRGSMTSHLLGRAPATAYPQAAPTALVAGSDRRLWTLSGSGVARVDLTSTCHVPDLTGAGASAARAALAAAGCGADIASPTSVTSQTGVVSQSPAAGTTAAAGTTVTARLGTLDAIQACRFGTNANVVASGPDAVVAVSTSTQEISTRTWWTCDRASRRIQILQQSGETHPSLFDPQLTAFAVAGTVVAYAAVSETHYGDGNIFVRLVDLASPDPTRSIPAGSPKAFGGGLPGSYMLSEIAADPGGAVAWIDQEDTARLQLLRPGAATPTTVATAPFGTLGALRFDGASVFWDERGIPHDAPL